jgi:hypothetical protein
MQVSLRLLENKRKKIAAHFKRVGSESYPERNDIGLRSCNVRYFSLFSISLDFLVLLYQDKRT